VLLAQGRLDEAEQQALEARRTVGPHDQSSRATTRMALGLVRAAQGETAEADLLLREAIDIIKETDFVAHHREILEALIGFLHAQGHVRDAAAYEEELAALARSAAPIA
jgi:ATP/maltotriose-dependent transcriptional regulator MalT